MGKRSFLSVFLLLLCISGLQAQGHGFFIRINEVGYRTGDPKIAIVFTNRKVRKVQCELIEADGNVVWGPVTIKQNNGSYGRYERHFRLDFTSFKKPGTYKIRVRGSGTESLSFRISDQVYDGLEGRLLAYLREQQCGYNPFLDQVCHQKDGRTMYGPMPDSTYIDVSGGWHDAGDDLKYLMTSSNTVGRLLFAYQENPQVFRDDYDKWGHLISNGIPDVLDEAHWGLTWMLKMHPAPDELFYQVADDRDHIGFKLPHADSSDYGWGKGSYRVVYYANGKPQGLGKYKNTSDGVANLAGRYAAVMAMAARIWKQDLHDTVDADRYLRAALQVYKLGLEKPGHQEGASFGAPYRYYEKTWTDDMEWGAAELYGVTRNREFLAQAIKYARLANHISWMGKDTAYHYAYYPFMNLGHYELFNEISGAFRDTLAGYYRTGLEACYDKAMKNPYRNGYPFIWCSNNLASALINQALLYQKMTGDSKYYTMAIETRDWLLGRNPWGASQFIGIPRNGANTPHYPHSSIEYLTGRPIIGGMTDGPVYGSIFKKFGMALSHPDRYAAFQSSVVVYHDDWNDFTSNEPTLDGTAEAFVWMSMMANEKANEPYNP